MKSYFPVMCPCGNRFDATVVGRQFPESTRCASCGSTIFLSAPLGDVVGMTILGRAWTELKDGDWTLAILLSAMAVECDLAYLFMKWNEVDLLLTRTPDDADRENWEEQWRTVR